MSSETPEGWTSQRFESVLSIQRGHDLPKRKRVDGDIPVIGAAGPTGWHDEGKIEGPTFTIGRSASIGELTWVDGVAWPLNTALYVTDFKGNDPRFLYYLLHTVDFTVYNSGTVQPMLNRNYVAGHMLDVPPVAEQRAIAEVLGALDDRLAHLARSRTLLLDLVVGSYRELPHEDYAQAPVGEVFDVTGGGTPSTKNEDYWDGPHCWLTPRDLSNSTSTLVATTDRTLTDKGLAKVSSGLLPPGTVVMSSRAPIGHLGVLVEPCAINQGFIALPPVEGINLLYALAWLKESLELIQSRAGGSTFSEISKRNFRPIPFPVPSGDEYERFSKIARACLAQLELVDKEADKLRQILNALLLRLVSGRLRITDVDGFLERAGLS